MQTTSLILILHSLIIVPVMHASKVDSEYLVGTRAKGGFPTRWAPKGHLAIPHGLLMTGIQPTTDLSHPRIPENVKVRHLKAGRKFIC